MQVEGIRRHHERPVPGVGAMYGPERLRERLAYADAVILTVPLSHSTQRQIGAADLQAMKRTAYLINVGRGATVDEASLVQALDKQRIAGAALYVFAEEPLAATSLL